MFGELLFSNLMPNMEGIDLIIMLVDTRQLFMKMLIDTRQFFMKTLDDTRQLFMKELS